jgi:hypothetical protein
METSPNNAEAAAILSMCAKLLNTLGETEAAGLTTEAAELAESVSGR